jgi:anti-anti-sigma factor
LAVDIRFLFAYNWTPFWDCEFGENENMLTVTIENLGEVTVLHCVGRMVRGNETAILCSALWQQARNLVLDLTRVDVIDAAGIGALVSLQAAGIYLKLLNPTEQVREVLRLTRLDSIFEICESRSTVVIAKSTLPGAPGDRSETCSFASSLSS